MKRAWLCAAALTGMLASPLAGKVKGYLFIIGGGDRPASLMKPFIELAGRFGNGKIVVFPMASSVSEERGAELVAEFKGLGARDVEYHNLTRERALEAQSAKILDNVGAVFFSGGDQSRQMAVLLHTPIHRKLLQLYEEGCVLGGTSAGAAVMSEVMITGEERRKVEEGDEFRTIEAKNIVTTEGLGFLKTAIVDQHFVARKRHNRLISLVAEKPDLLGIAIEESTAIIVEPDQTFRVIGAKNVVIYDAARAAIRITPSQAIGFKNMVMHLLLPGDRFDLKTRKMIR